MLAAIIVGLGLAQTKGLKLARNPTESGFSSVASQACVVHRFETTTLACCLVRQTRHETAPALGPCAGYLLTQATREDWRIRSRQSDSIGAASRASVAEDNGERFKPQTAIRDAENEGSITKSLTIELSD